MTISSLYAIVDAEMLARHSVGVRAFAQELRDAGVRLVQYRDKVSGPQETLRAAAEIRAVFAGTRTMLILNDRADLAALAGWDGVHVGQGDLLPADARKVMGTGKVVGVSTHNEAQVVVVERGSSRLEGAGGIAVASGAAGPSTTARKMPRACAQDDSLVGDAEESEAPDYVAIGPVFATSTKLDAEPVVGLEGVRRARALTQKSLVAIGGITRENARSVIEAGADSVAVIGALLPAEGMSARQRAEELIALLGG
jgi:thiamine-phosphate pyrophosphorylase